MRSFWRQIRWTDVVVGAIVWGLFTGEWLLLGRAFPAERPGWDLQAPLYALFTVPFWYAGWALALRPCPWQLRWLTPLAVSYGAYQLAALGGWGPPVAIRVAVIVVCYAVVAAAMSAVNAASAASRDRRA
jgi:hypothetical protein